MESLRNSELLPLSVL